MNNTVHLLSALNSARASNNPLHKDEAAQALGYARGLVPGVDMYAYMTFAPAQKWGVDWLSRGDAEVSLLKPIYEGDACSVDVVEQGDRHQLVELRVGESVRAKARFSLRQDGETVSVGPVPPRAAQIEPRPHASLETLAPGTVLGTITRVLKREDTPKFLEDMRDTLDLYMADGLVPAGFLLRCCNWALSENVVLGPWIHTYSKIRHFAPARLDQPFEVRPVVEANYEKSGHRFVEVDISIVDAKATPFAQVRHVAIYEPRPKN